MVIQLKALKHPIKIANPFKFNIYTSIITNENLEELYKTVPLGNMPLSVRLHGSDKTYSLYNKVLHDLAENVTFTSHKLSLHWENLLSEILSNAYLEAISKSFDRDLAKCHVQIMLKKYATGGFISMHTDDIDVEATQLFFLNPYFDFSSGGDLIFHDGNGDMVSRIPPSSNTSILFERSDNSWHSVEACKSEISPKLTLQVAFWKKLKKRSYHGRSYE